METGKFKVFSPLLDWFEEFRLYHRKDGKVVKEGDDLLAATRYAVMMLRFAEQIYRKREMWPRRRPVHGYSWMGAQHDRPYADEIGRLRHRVNRVGPAALLMRISRR